MAHYYNRIKLVTNYCMGNWSLVCQLSIYSSLLGELSDSAHGGDFHLSTLIKQTNIRSSTARLIHNLQLHKYIHNQWRTEEGGVGG